MEKGKSDSHTQIGQNQTPLRTRIPGHQPFVNFRKKFVRSVHETNEQPTMQQDNRLLYCSLFIVISAIYNIYWRHYVSDWREIKDNYRNIARKEPIFKQMIHDL
jgi:hypothetical protein